MTEEEYKRRRTASQLAALTLANAFVFQAELAKEDSDVKPLRRLLDQSDPVTALVDHWEYICDEINYVPIFHLAREVLLDAPVKEEFFSALRTLGDKVQEIVAKRAALRHDLMGRIYHRLLLEAKYLGTYYTSVPAATILAKLTLDPQQHAIDWSRLEEIGEFRVADFACGTGTLLMACQQAITDNYIRGVTAEGEEVTEKDLPELHRLLMEEVFYGYDVLSSAVHLTASTLALLAPEIAFRKTNLVCLPLGETGDGTTSLGSIEFFHETEGTPPQLGLVEDEESEELEELPTAVSGEGGASPEGGVPRDLDVCVMNPPFTRSVGGNLLFGSLPEEQRSELQDKLKNILSRSDGRSILASTTAGLGSVFTALADVYLKRGGRLGLVLPAAVGFGAAWEKTRKLFENNYELEYVISSHDPEQWNFSENTELSEVLLVLRRLKGDESQGSGSPQFVSLWQNPQTPVDALAISDLVRNAEPAKVHGTNGPNFGVTELTVDSKKWGETVQLPWRELEGDQWYPAAFSQTDLIRAAHYLRKGQVYVPGRGITGSLPLASLTKLGELGPDVRDIYDGFERASSETSYVGYWGHDSDRVKFLEMDTNTYLNPLSEAKKGRPLRDADLLWSRSGRVMIAERLWLLTQRMTAVRLPEYALSNTWWPFRLDEEDDRAEKALVLWLNSTLGIINTLSHRVPTRGPWIKFKKPFLRSMPVVDVASLDDSQLNRAAVAFDSIKAEVVRPLSEFREDDTRTAIDDALAEIIGIESVQPLQELLGREPIVTDRRLDEPVGEVDTQTEFGF